MFKPEGTSLFEVSFGLVVPGTTLIHSLSNNCGAKGTIVI